MICRTAAFSRHQVYAIFAFMTAFVEKVSPVLHDFGAVGQVFRFVVDGSNFIFTDMRKLHFDVRCIEALLIEIRGRNVPPAMAGHTAFVAHFVALVTTNV